MKSITIPSNKIERFLDSFGDIAMQESESSPAQIMSIALSVRSSLQALWTMVSPTLKGMGANVHRGMTDFTHTVSFPSLEKSYHKEFRTTFTLFFLTLVPHLLMDLTLYSYFFSGLLHVFRNEIYNLYVHIRRRAEDLDMLPPSIQRRPATPEASSSSSSSQSTGEEEASGVSLASVKVGAKLVRSLSVQALRDRQMVDRIRKLKLSNLLSSRIIFYLFYVLLPFLMEVDDWFIFPLDLILISWALSHWFFDGSLAIIGQDFSKRTTYFRDRFFYFVGFGILPGFLLYLILHLDESYGWMAWYPLSIFHVMALHSQSVYEVGKRDPKYSRWLPHQGDKISMDLDEYLERLVDFLVEKAVYKFLQAETDKPLRSPPKTQAPSPPKTSPPSPSSSVSPSDNDEKVTKTE